MVACAMVLALGACDGPETPLQPSVRADLEKMPPEELELPPGDGGGSGGSGGALDPAIDRSNTYAVADVVTTTTSTTTSDEPMYDPATGTSVTTLSTSLPPEASQLQAGFDQSGQSVATTVHAVGPDSAGSDPENVVRTRLVGTVMTDLNAAGQVVLDHEDEAQAEDAALVLLDPGGISLVDALVAAAAPDAEQCVSGSRCVSIVGSKVVQSPGSLAGGTPGGTWAVRRSPVLVDLVTEIGGQGPAASVQGARATRTVPDATPGSATGQLRSRTTHSYKQHQGGKWLLSDVVVEGDVDAGGVRRQYRHAQHFTYRAYHENAARDAARRARPPVTPRASAAVVAPASTVVPRGARTHAPRSAASVAVADERGENEGTCVPAQRIEPGPTGRPGIVFQHGIWSSSCTWRNLQGLVETRYSGQFGARVTSNTHSTETYDFQREELLNELRASGGSDWIFVGHSNGGLVSRRAAQKLARNFHPPRGVLAINSPHYGAPAMETALGGVNAVYQAVMKPFAYLCLGSTPRRGCGEVQMLTASSSIVNRLYRLQYTGIYREMVPNSDFRWELNNQSESFRRVGIVSHTPQKWLAFRMFAEIRCNPIDADLKRCVGGREQANRTDRFAKHLAATTAMATLVIAYCKINPCLRSPLPCPSTGLVANPTLTCPIVDGTVIVAATSAGLWSALQFTDAYYRRVVSPGDDSDGIVPGRSQEYPRAERLIHRFDADTHVGSTSSERMQPLVFSALQVNFGLTGTFIIVR